MKRWITPLVAAITLAAAAPAGAATITVTSTTDPPSPSCPGTTTCVSLRAALARAQVLAGADTILVPAGTTVLQQGLLNVDSPVTIRGAGARLTVITMGQLTDRVFDVGASASPSTITRLTMSGGTSAASGGNLFNNATLLLDHVRVTGGSAPSGGGGGIFNGEEGTLTIGYSLIDTNDAPQGAGILNAGSDSASHLIVRDSTIASNEGSTSGGVGQVGFPDNTTVLERVTLALNHAGGGAGGIDNQSGSFQIRASILDRNDGDNPDLNCGGGITSLGANVSHDGTCVTFTAAGDLINTNPLLTTALVNAGGQTNVFAIASASPARDRAGACSGADQRDLVRPQNGVCDSGAYEIDTPPQTSLSVTAAPKPGDAPIFTFASSEPGVTFQCRLNAAAFAACVSPKTYALLAAGTYTFAVRAVDATGTPDPTPAATAFTVVEPEPEFHENVVVDELSGTIRVRLPGSNQFISLDVTRGIPLGSTVDARNGVVELTSQAGPNGKDQKAKFYDGIFKVTQPGKITDLKLTESLAKCKKKGTASAAAKKKKKRRLWGSGKGRFRTSGRYSSATVRGTKWLVQDSCAGTLTRVVRGVVSIRDKVRHKTIRLRKGKRYLARPKR
jgi:hypothetical protein